MPRVSNSRLTPLSFAMAALVLSGCRSQYADQLNGIRLGMTREQVIDELGEPNSTGASPTEEVLRYHWYGHAGAWSRGIYFVKLVDGRVQSFGSEKDLK